MQEQFGSQWEQNIYMALVAEGIDFQYQVPMFGGRGRRGGTVVDFIIYQPPLRIALYVDGPYWHKASRQTDDTMIRAQLERRGYRVLKVVEESATEEAARAWVKANLK